MDSTRATAADSANDGPMDVGGAGGAAPDSGERPFQKQQGADRPNEEPDAATEEGAIRRGKEDNEGAMGRSGGDGYGGGSSARDGGDDYSGGSSGRGGNDDYSGGSSGRSGGDDYSGGSSGRGGDNEYSGGSSGRGGDNEYSGGSSGRDGGNEYSGGDDVRSGGSAKRDEGGAKDSGDMGSSSTEEQGTGTEYVKSTGMKADGGDFDAKNPGAGAEADRLLEQKGIHTGGNTGPPQEYEGQSGGAEEKQSMGSKIKDKLHMGKN